MKTISAFLRNEIPRKIARESGLAQIKILPASAFNESLDCEEADIDDVRDEARRTATAV